MRDERRGSLFLAVSSLVAFGLRLEAPLPMPRPIPAALVSVVPIPFSFLYSWIWLNTCLLVGLSSLFSSPVSKDFLISSSLPRQILFSLSVSPHPKVPEDIRLDQQRYHDMLRTKPNISLGEGWRPPPDYEEKAVDVILAINLVMMARNNDYDVAYLITGDSDLTPAVEMARQIGKEVILIYFWDKNRPKEERRFSFRLARAASSRVGFKKKWVRPI